MEHVNNIKTVENKFIQSLGSGVSAGEHLLTLMQNVVTSRDTPIIARVWERAAKKGDSDVVSVLRLVTGAIFPGAKLVKNKDSERPTIKIKGVEADMDALARLEKAVEKKLSLRHQTFRKLVKGVEPEKEFTWDDTSKKRTKNNLHKLVDKYGLSPDAFVAFAQEWAKEEKNKEQVNKDVE